MPDFRPSADLDMHYRVDDFTDPWRQPETVLMLHGNAESGLAWYAWVPNLARQYRVVRPDMRGFGEFDADAGRSIRGRSIVWSRISACCWIISVLTRCHLVGCEDRRHDRARLCRAPARAADHADSCRHAAAAARGRRRARAGIDPRF